MLPTTPERVPAHTSEPVNRSIRDEIAGSVRWHSRHPERIDRRLHELDEEWDIERTLEANAATLALTGSVLGIFVDKRFLAVPVVVHGFPASACPSGLVPTGPVLPKARCAHDA